MLENPSAPINDLTRPLVSVAITSFNSAKWISTAIRSVLRQDAPFAIEIVVGDDCSSDETVSIARGFAEKYPTIVHVLERSARLGIQRNFYETFEHCCGRYIAWLDADDYWTDPSKLQRQVEVLTEDPSVSVCAHFVRSVNAEDEVVKRKLPVQKPGRYGLRDLVLKNFIPSPSILFRNGLQKNLPQSYFSLPKVADWAVLIEGCLVGDVLLLDATMADYRLTPGSAYSSTGPVEKERIDTQFYTYLGQRLPKRFLYLINEGKAGTYLDLAYELRSRKQFAESYNASWKALLHGGMRCTARAVKSFTATFVSQLRSLMTRKSADPNHPSS